MLRIVGGLPDRLPVAAKTGLPFGLAELIDRPFDGVLTLMCPDWRGPALVLEGPHWHVAHANRCCRDLLAGPDAFAFLSEERLIFRDSAFHDRFQACLDAVERFPVGPVMLIGEAENGWFSTAIRQPPGPCRDHLTVEFAMTGRGFEPAARDAFAAAFALTPAEMEVVELIAMGHGAEVAARRRGSALSTIRQRVKTVLAKTGCRRQLELARLVTALLPA